MLDRGDAADLIDLVRHQRGLSKAEKRFPRKDTCLAIYSHRVNTQRPLKETLQTMFPWCAEWEDALSGLFKDYVEKKLATHALDYDDLLLYWHAMSSDPALAAEIGAQFDHIGRRVSGHQRAAAEILKGLRPSGVGLTVVGDDAQAIYSFRAATIENIVGFADRFGNARTVVLEENYRSTQPVLDAANALIGKSLRSRKGKGPKPRYVTVSDEAQAQYGEGGAETRERGVRCGARRCQLRSSHHWTCSSSELRIPHEVRRAEIEAAHVKDLLAVLRWPTT